MNTNKVLMGGLAGGIAFFFLGWIIYGMLLKDFMMSNGNNCAMRAEADFVWWAMILSNLLSGLFYALIFDWANIRGFAAGAKAGAILGVLLGLSMDLSFWAMSTMWNTITGVIVDAISCAVMTAIVCGIIGWVMGRGNTPSPAPAPTV